MLMRDVRLSMCADGKSAASTGSEEEGNSGGGDALGLGYGSEDASEDEAEQEHAPVQEANSNALVGAHVDGASENNTSSPAEAALAEITQHVAGSSEEAKKLKGPAQLSEHQAPASEVLPDANSTEEDLQASESSKAPASGGITSEVANGAAATFSKGDRCDCAWCAQ